MHGNTFCLRSSSVSSSQGSGGPALLSTPGPVKASQWTKMQMKGTILQCNAGHNASRMRYTSSAIPNKGQNWERACVPNASAGIATLVQGIKHVLYNTRRYVVSHEAPNIGDSPNCTACWVGRCFPVTSLSSN